MFVSLDAIKEERVGFVDPINVTGWFSLFVCFLFVYF